ncbi:MAG: threonylcarbamoyl-AMP synthase [Rhizobiales bacterium 65-9]|nr:threonylcarbamoyl-AMP synthase [Hyphomicrobiales bacterium]OJY38054.1 MAG: threonylcarbamoyl-AMP synthase [Rhizobiales bacterium 65-9]
MRLQSDDGTRRLRDDEAGIEEAAAILRAGGTVAFPTETVYGLGADATNGEAVARIYAAKGRPRFNPLIAHLPDAEAAFAQGRFDEAAQKLAAAFWPGPLTLVVPLSEKAPISDLARAGLPSIGLRVPHHPAAEALLRTVARPVVAPSANRSGHVSPTTADHVLADLDGRIDAVLDGGSTRVGVESTIVACLDGAPRLLRAGGVPREALEAALGRPLAEAGEAVIAPGMLASHYAPAARLRLDADAIEPGEAALLLGAHAPAGLDRARVAINLSPRGDLGEAAARLFAALRDLDAAGVDTVAVAPIPRHGLGEAIRDRLLRAAAPRG